MTHRDRSKYKTDSSVMAVCKPVTIPGMTGHVRRNTHMDRLRLAVSQARRNGQKFAVFFIDLDNFKAINDAYGHGIGDQLLQKVASGLKHCLREGDTLARYGGDEFMALLPSLDEKKDAATVARKCNPPIFKRCFE